jgi:uncharacterized membrane protein YeaQ/YmgE (transglycosylase-associated protein family)
MWGGIGGLVIQLSAGGICANIAAELLRKYDLGAMGNTLAGIVGGTIGGQIVGALVGGAAVGAPGGGLDIGSIVAQFVCGGLGGSVLLVIIGLVRQATVGQTLGG